MTPHTYRITYRLTFKDVDPDIYNASARTMIYRDVRRSIEYLGRKTKIRYAKYKAVVWDFQIDVVKLFVRELCKELGEDVSRIVKLKMQCEDSEHDILEDLHDYYEEFCNAA